MDRQTIIEILTSDRGKELMVKYPLLSILLWCENEDLELQGGK